MSGQESADCYSTETGLLLSTESTASTQFGPIKNTTHHADYRRFGPVLLPTVQSSSAAGVTQRLTLVSYDPTPAAAGRVALPPEIKALSR